MDAVEEVKARLNIEDVVGEYVELKRAGRNFKGLSPFSSEKSPSFMVSPEKGIWHDFSSGKGGTMFTFVMEMEGLSFKEALELLARKAGVDLSQFGGSRGRDNSKQRERLYQALELAAKFYQVQFSKNKVALEYVLGKRQFTKETALEWQLGYAPNTGSALCEFLTAKGFTPKEIKDAGLSAQRYRGLGDMFRGRLMIPLHDAQGKVIGFTARLLEDVKDAPKYINTPQTLLYDKSRHVYGLHLAKEGIRKSAFVVLVEGNLDVIQSHQAGVRQVVATAGTAMTEYHLKALSKFTGDIRLSFDADKAGINATERAIPIASKVGVSLSMISISNNSLGAKDPDELIKQDAGAWRQVIEQNQYALDWLIERYKGQLDLGSAEGKRKFSDVLLPVVRQLQDSVERDHYIQELARTLGVSREALAAKYQQTTKSPARAELKKAAAAPQPDSRQAITIRRAQNRLLAFALMRPGLRRYLQYIEPDMLPDPDARVLLQFLKDNPDFTGQDAAQMRTLQPVADYVKILTVAYEEEHFQDTPDADLKSGASHQQVTIVDQYVKTKQQYISAAYQEADDDGKQQLATELSGLTQLLARAKEEV
ncbi:MAG TPA: DNA primase [Candidatus Saccharimonadales bacterium]|nr:DNA primase [Candidatus Saccharimonadales bacterium]